MNSDKILVTSYVNPDLDGFACAFAYTEYLAAQQLSPVLSITGTLHTETTFLLNKYNIPYKPASISPSDFKKIILVDASDLEGIDPNINLDDVIEIIDHRKVNEKEAFKNARLQIELVGAAATLIAEKFINNKIKISKDSAVLLYGAIVSNTLNFKANVTTHRDKDAAEYLKTIFHPESDFELELFKSKSIFARDKLAEKIEHDFATFNFDNKKIGVGQLEMINGKNIVAELKTEILKTLNDYDNFDYLFLSVIDLNNNQNVFVCNHSLTKTMLEFILNVGFNDNVAIRQGFIMRKEIMPLIKEYIINNN